MNYECFTNIFYDKYLIIKLLIFLLIIYNPCVLLLQAYYTAARF